MNVLNNLRSDFTGAYFHYDSEPESDPESEEGIAEKTKLRRQRLDEIAKKEKIIDSKLFREYLEYLSPNDMYKNLNNTTGSEENKTQVNTMKSRLANLVEAFKSNPTSDAKKITTRNNMLDIVKLILEFNQLNQSRQGLKILTPNQILSRLPISLAHLKAGNNTEKLKKRD